MDSLLDRFLRYVRIDTQADEKSTTYPSSPGQRELGKLLAAELRGFGLADAAQDAHGIVTATVPGHTAGPVIAWLAHVDTSPETSGRGVKPVVHENYAGGDIVLPGDRAQVIRVSDCPELKSVVGHTLITSDGTTLLGGDDKCGVAVVMEAVKYLCEHPDTPHGPIRICFTCDEEVGRGVLHVEPAALGAVVGYTLDGGGVGEIENETFSADKATVAFTGVNIHPSIAKGRMVSAVRAAASFVNRMEVQFLSPESTAGREGFIHPYTIHGGVGSASVELLLRSFDTAMLSQYAKNLDLAAGSVLREYPGTSYRVTITKQYRNMADGLAKEPRAVGHAHEAMRRAGLTPKLGSIRGGTDGAILTEKGLPTPNLSTGEHNIHSPLEWTSLEEMRSAVRVLVELAGVWAEA